MITITTATIDDAYNEVTTWRKNTFFPYGKTGRDFIDQLTKLIDDWNNRSPMQHLALKAAIVLLATALQKMSYETVNTVEKWRDRVSITRRENDPTALIKVEQE